jgi:HlyD family secretion protein
MKRLLLLFLILIIACGGDKTGIYSGIFTEENYILKAEVGGKIKAFPFEEGAATKKEDTLVFIDNREIKLTIESLEYQFKNLKIQLKNLEKDLKESKKLYGGSAISQWQFEKVQTNRDMVYMQLKSAYANLEAKKENLKKFYIISPVNGYISSKYLKAGESVFPGIPILEILDTSVMYLNVYVPEDQLHLISINQSVKIKIDAFPDEFFKGRVSFISKKAEFTPKNIQTREDRTLLVYRVKIIVDNPEGKIKSGIYGDAVLQ